MRKKAQEEMVGFILIVVIVSVILLVFLIPSLNKSDTEVESYEVQGFIQSFLQYTTNCEKSFGKQSVQDLIFACESGEMCGNQDSCEVLEEILEEILKESWEVGEEFPAKGYDLKIISEMEEREFQEGSETNNFKGGMQDFSKGGEYIQIFFTVYY